MVKKSMILRRNWPISASLVIVAFHVSGAAKAEKRADLDESQSIARSAAVPVPVVITFGRALDLAGQPMNPFPKSQLTRMMANARASRNLIAGPLQMPRGMPVSAVALTGGFGNRIHPIYGSIRGHAGIDLAAPFLSPVYATLDGYVSSASWSGGYGLCVNLYHAGDLQTRFGHLQQFNVSAGQYVRRGDVIGFVGSTGLSTGPHLHYEIRLRGQALNPYPYLSAR